MAQTQNNQSQPSYLEKVLQELLQNGYGNFGKSQGVNYAQAVQAQMAAKDPRYAAGSAIASLLKALGLTPQNWAKNYRERGALKQQLQDDLTAKWGDNASNTIEDLKNQGIWDNYRKLAAYSQNPQTGSQQTAPTANTPLQQTTPLSTQKTQQNWDFPLLPTRQQPWDNWQENAIVAATPEGTQAATGFAPEMLNKDELIRKYREWARQKNVDFPFQDLG